ncbi:MAG: hypothetical protein ACSHWU_03365 [Marinicella sp.]
MKTLHLYHWQDNNSLNQHLPLLGQKDSLVIYGIENSDAVERISQNLADCPNNWYLVIHNNCPNMSDKQIDHSQWLKLITQHHNTLAWK